VKVQHADIEEISQLDLEILGRVLAIVRLVVRLRGLESYHGDIGAAHSRELDFEREARNIATIRDNFVSSPDVHFPTVLPELRRNACSRRADCRRQGHRRASGSASTASTALPSPSESQSLCQ